MKKCLSLLFALALMSSVSFTQEKTERALKNLSAVLAAAGSNMDRVVKTTVFLKNMSDFPAMNEVYGQFFKNEPPSRSTVQVAALPKDALIEIEAVELQ